MKSESNFSRYLFLALIIIMWAGTASALAPVVTGIPDQTVDEGSTFTSINLDLYVTDDNTLDEDISWTYTGSSELSVSIVDRIATISIPDSEWNGSETISFTAMDNEPTPLSSSDSATFTVTEVNQPPIITSTAPPTATEDVEYTYIPTATDSDIPANTLTWLLTNEPTGMTINASSGSISWIPGDVSTSGTVTLTVDDNNGGTDTEQFAIVVTNVNDIPVIISTAGTVAQEDIEYLYIAEATDADPADKLTWSLSNEPDGMKIKNPPTGSTAEITWTPAEGIASSGAVSLTVDDSKGGTDTETWTITVTSFNDPPQITSVAPPTATEDVEYTYNPIATDPDIPVDTLTWSLVNEPTGMAIMPSTGAISWTPAEGVTTSGTVTLTVDDNNGGVDTEVFTISVTAVNEPPEIISTASSTATEDVEYTYNPTATDPDIPADTLTWSLTNKPTGMVINPSTGAISWTPGDVLDSGIVTLTVSDNKGGTDTEVFTIAVTGINDAPQITSGAPATATEDVVYTYNPTATDPDIPSDTLTWSLSGAPPGMSFNLSTGTISWTPGEGVITSGPLTLAVTDGNGGTDTENWTITVTAVNDPPQITSEAFTAANTGFEYQYTATATDVDTDDDSLEWSFDSTIPLGMTLEPGTGSSTTITWTPPSGVESSGVITLKVSDGDKSDTQTFTIEVTDKPFVIMDQVEQVNTTTATVNASVLAPGIPPAEEHGICWGDKEDLTTGDDCTKEGPVSAVGPYTRELTGLTLGETYYVRAYAINDTGSGPEPVYSEVIAFQTHFPPKATLSETMAPLTNITTYSLQVGGIGVVSYKYRLDGGPWRDEQLVSQKIVENDLGEGPHSLQVVGKTESLTTGGIWQTEQDATEVSWVVDLTPPLAEIVNHPTGTIGPFGNDILVKGDEMAVYSYSLDEGSTWSTIYPVSVPIVLSDLNEGRNTLSVVGADFAGNWQDDDKATTIEWIVDALVPTALLTNLPEAITQDLSVSIGVATPEGGEPVEEYYYRFEDNDDWSYGKVSQTIDQSWPQGGEGEHTLCVNAGNGQDVWQDGSDGDGQSSIGSATCYTWRIDLTPAIVEPLTAENTERHFKQEQFLPASKSVKLSWSWSSDDPAEAITHYRVWYSLSEITQDTLDNAVELFCNIIPGKEGFVESMIVNGLDTDETYHFAVSAIDLAGNESALSVYADVITPDTIPEIHTLEFVGQSGLTTDNSAADELLISGANFLGSVGGNLVRFESDTTSFELSSLPGSAGEISVDIPLGIPIGQYRVRIINKFGVSLSSIERVVITEANTPLPAVRLVDPLVIAVGTGTRLKITGDNFSKTLTEVNLLDAGGVPVLSADFEWDNHTISALVIVPEGFSTGQYHIQVVNDDGGFNAMSAARLEIGLPMDVNTDSGATATSGILRLEGGLIPAFTFLSSDDSAQNGAPKKNVAGIEVTLEPGTVFEKQQEDGEWVPYEEAILPPRMVSPAAYTNSGIGADIVAFSMGAPERLRLGGEAIMFVALDVTLPSSITEPVVYQGASDGSLTPAGVDGAWRGTEVAVGGTILAERLNVPQTGVTTFTLGVLLDHMSDYVVGTQQGAVPLPEPDTMGASDEYGVCFIGAADAAPRGSLLYIAVLGLLIVGALFYFRKPYQRSLAAVLLIVALAGFLLTAQTVGAAEGAAAEPTADTEEEGIAIPGETETEQEAVDILKDTETEYVPAAASSVRKRTRRNGGERHWNIHAGLGYAYIGQEDTATYNGTEVKHALDGDLYPILGVSYAFSKRWALELSLHRDFYSGEISNSLSGSSSKLEGITANLSALFWGGPYTWPWIGTYRPYGLAGFGYRTLDGDLDYPVTSYKPAIGAVLGIGMLKGKWDFRLGYSFFKHDADSTKDGYTGSGGELDTSGIYFEIAYHFLKF